MESIQSQIGTLIQKVDLVYQILTHLASSPRSGTMALTQHQLDDRNSVSIDPQICNDRDISIESNLGSDPRRIRRNYTSYPNNGYANLPGGANYRYDTAEWVIAGQDLPIDNNGARVISATTIEGDINSRSTVENRHQIREQDLDPRIQIQRLTAQLTVAYNRIAALEEQLLAKRRK
jgi:hypothetical protein